MKQNVKHLVIVCAPILKYTRHRAPVSRSFFGTHAPHTRFTRTLRIMLKTLNVQSKNYKSTRLQQRLALESARKQKEMKGMILDSRKTLFMSLRDNTGINWYRAKQILKHLEVHQRHPNVTSQAMREKITEIANLVKQGK
ncbi:conserved hypothetical protein [Theileria equi strain WA]|uniref:Uncharacterized protein n=1 Tax=Theileria equi strain WA TaxID=1537102 RepID=L1LAD6_THEEQ|nr:conserved hypothetical protein [Theileria equi strain WA]EKX72219.1 conserved hypothetical protein [Theileria equi strain WA]|eukprot:XP_004831671.1 conserved hypothetical protein [Theileria equi strain WA]